MGVDDISMIQVLSATLTKMYPPSNLFVYVAEIRAGVAVDTDFQMGHKDRCSQRYDTSPLMS